MKVVGQWVKTLTGKLAFLSLTPKSHIVEGKNDNQRLQCIPGNVHVHVHTVKAHAYTQTHTQAHSK